MRRKERLETSPFGPRENTTMMWKQRWMRYIFEFRRSLNIDSCDSNRTIPRSEMNRFALDLRSSRAHARKY
jgi:ADP-dependent phosphofructokinase/glucokinase